MTVPEIKSAILTQMERQRITKAELSRRLGVPASQVSRLCDPNYNSSLPTLLAALNALGLTLAVRRLP